MKGKKALLILDMLNELKFPEGKLLEKRARPVARRIARLKERCKKAKIPVIYVNDNFGDWNADWKSIYQTSIQENCLGKSLARLLPPEEDDFFVLKPKHSGFYSTNLDPMLKDLGVKTLILTGIAGDICVLFTAHDAHMREYDLLIPHDCCASNTATGDRFLRHQFEKTLKFPTTISDRIRL
jgi:nicotinamidase-related amidase